MLRALLFLLLGATVFAQEEVTVEPAEGQDHHVGTFHSLHSKTPPPFGSNTVTLQVIVDATGKVESAHSLTGPAEFSREAEALELKRKFTPFERNGIPVRATFQDYVLILPSEKRADSEVAFPEVRDWTTLRMKLERTGCYGPCPAYSVEVSGDGNVEFIGLSNVLLPGHHHGHLSEQAVRNLLSEFKNADYFSLKGNYSFAITDCATYKTSIEFDGRVKSVRDYVGLHVGMPEAVADLERAIDEAAGTEKWVKGNDQTGPALVAEKWDFSSNTEENRKLFSIVVAQGSEDLIRLFLANGAAPLGLIKDGSSPLMSAAEKGNLELVHLFLDKQTKGIAAVVTCALGAAAHNGSLALVRYLIEKGGDPNGQLCGRRYEAKTVLMEAAESGNAEVIEEILKYHPDVKAGDQNGSTALDHFLQTNARGETPKVLAMLLAAGADVNHHDSNNQTPIFHACLSSNVEAIAILLKAGADVNARGRFGQTVLMSCYDPGSLKALIAAGADLSVRDDQGHTAAEEARQSGGNDKADLLEAAMREQKK